MNEWKEIFYTFCVYISGKKGGSCVKKERVLSDLKKETSKIVEQTDRHKRLGQDAIRNWRARIKKKT